MKKNKSNFENTKDKIVGEIKEAAGKISGNEQLELKGKIQSSKADLKKKMNVNHLASNAKEGIAGKINDMLDKKGKK